MQALVLVLHVLVCLSLVALVLLQHGKGADVGAAFGSGASNTMFGSQGVTPFLVKVTSFLALVFFLTSLGLAHMASSRMQKNTKSNNLLNMPVPQTQAPTAPTNSIMLPKSSTSSSTKKSGKTKSE